MNRDTSNRPGSEVELGPHVWGAWIALAAGLLAPTQADPDLWGHVRFGLDWLRTRTWSAVDAYSFTQDRPWMNHEWLSEVLMAAAFRLGGSTGLVLLKIAIAGSALAILRSRLRGCTPVVTVLTLATAIVAALATTSTVRPHLWSLLGLVLLIAIIDTPNGPKGRHVIGSALVFAFWANLHGGWITGVTVLVVYASVRTLRSRQQVTAWLSLVAGSLAATLINPYGIGLWRFLASTVRPSRPDITEWEPLGVSHSFFLWVPIVAPLVIALLLSARSRVRLPLEVWSVLLVLVYAGLRVVRVAPLMAPAALALLAPRIAGAWGQRWQIATSNAIGARILLIPVLVALSTAAIAASRFAACVYIPESRSWTPDRAAAAHLDGLEGRVWTTFDWGEYVIWHFGPRLRVSIDGRRETVYSEDILEWHRAFENGEPGAQQRFLTLSPEYVWLPSVRGGSRAWLLTHGYVLAYETNASFIAARRDVLRPLHTNAALPACFE